MDVESFTTRSISLTAGRPIRTTPRRPSRRPLDPERNWWCCATPMVARCRNALRQRTGEAIGALGNYAAQVGIHCHNDCELAVANSLAAVKAGAVHVQGTINGIGERCGNVDLISVIANLGLKYDVYQILGGKDLRHLTELSRFVYETANMPFRTSQPFVGSSAFAHKGGMHVHAVEKVAHSYEHVGSGAGGERAANPDQ